MVRPATDDEMVSIRALLSRGYVVTGYGYCYSIKDGWLHIERID